MEDEIMHAPNQDEGPATTDGLRQAIRDPVPYTHSRLNSNTTKIHEAASFLYALMELSSEKGGIAIEALDEHKKVVGERLAQEFRAKAMRINVATADRFLESNFDAIRAVIFHKHVANSPLVSPFLDNA